MGGTTGIDPALFGVVFNPGFAGFAPDSGNYRSDGPAGNRTQANYSPLLDQPFFLGRPRPEQQFRRAGSDQTFTIPGGAAFLLLGVSVDCCLNDNFGSGYNVQVFDNSPVSEPASLLLVGVGLVGVRMVARRRL